jgi:hypothetical protein
VRAIEIQTLNSSVGSAASTGSVTDRKKLEGESVGNSSLRSSNRCRRAAFERVRACNDRFLGFDGGSADVDERDTHNQTFRPRNATIVAIVMTMSQGTTTRAAFCSRVNVAP